jgi:hypothetical protein
MLMTSNTWCHLRDATARPYIYMWRTWGATSGQGVPFAFGVTRVGRRARRGSAGTTTCIGEVERSRPTSTHRAVGCCGRARQCEQATMVRKQGSIG